MILGTAQRDVSSWGLLACDTV